MAGEIETLNLIEATHGIGHDSDGYAGRFVLADRPVRVNADGAVRTNELGQERTVAATIINIQPLLKEVA